MRNAIALLLLVCAVHTGAQVYTFYADVHPVNDNFTYVVRPSSFIMTNRNPPSFNILPCTQFDDVGPNFVMRITMGEYVDYFRLTDLVTFMAENPNAGDMEPTLCTFLTTTVQVGPVCHYDWTNTLTNPFLTHIPSILADNVQIIYTGGSKLNWLGTLALDHPEYLIYENEDPDRVRTVIPLWGSGTNSNAGGCCWSTHEQTRPSWSLTYRMDLLLYPTLNAPTLAVGGPNTILVSWVRKYDASISYYILEQSINNGPFTAVGSGTLAPAVPNPFPVVVNPTDAYRFRISTVNDGAERTFTSSPSAASISLRLSAPPTSSTGGGNTGGGSGSHTGSGAPGTGNPPPAPTGPVIVVVNPSDYDTTAPVAAPYVDVILLEQLLDGTQGRDAIWYTYTTLDKTPVDPNCGTYPPIGTRSLGGSATIPITAGVVLKAVACSKDGEPAPVTASGFTGPWNRRVTPVMTAIIPVKAESALTHPSYMAPQGGEATLAAVVVGNTTTVSFHSATNNPGFSYLFGFGAVPQCPPYTAPQPSSIELSSSVDMVVVTCAAGVIPADPVYLHVLLFVAEPLVQAFAPVDARGVRIQITSSTWGAQFVFTTDGSVPRCDGSNLAQLDYDGDNPVYIALDGSNGNLTVVGCKAGLISSDAVHYNLALDQFVVADPVVVTSEGQNPLGGDVRVELRSSTPGAKLWYTLDGVSTPACKAAVGQTSPVSFVLYKNATVQVVACLVAGTPPIIYSSHVVSQFVLPSATRSGDSDSDGVVDGVDDCPASLQVGAMLAIDTCQPAVTNQLLAPYPMWTSKKLERKFNFHLRYGCTMRDIIDLCQNVALFSSNMGQAFQEYLACTEAHVRLWGPKRFDLLTSAEVDRVMACVAQAPFPLP